MVDHAETHGLTPHMPQCGEPGHVHERPSVEQLDESWIGAFSVAALENQLMGARAGMNEVEDTPLTLVMLGVRIAAMLSRYMPELSERLQLAVLANAKTGNTD